LEFEPPDVDRLQASLLRTEEITLRDEIWKYLKRMLASGIRDTDPTSSDKINECLLQRNDYLHRGVIPSDESQLRQYLVEMVGICLRAELDDRAMLQK
jgi:hypothetical protein